MESLTVELVEKRVLKRVTLLIGEQDMEPSGGKIRGKLELEKFLKNFSAKELKALSEGDLARLSTFLLQKEV